MRSSALSTTALLPDGFRVAIIPETFRRTTLGFRNVGDRVNLEADVLGKVVAKLVGRDGAAGGLTMDRLRDAGW